MIYYNIRYEDIKWNFDFCSDSVVKQIEKITEGCYTIDNPDYIEKLRLYTYKIWKANLITVKQFIEITTLLFSKIKLKKIEEERDDLPF